MSIRLLLVFLFAVLLSLRVPAAPVTSAKYDLDKPDGWYTSADAQRIAANVLSNQSPLGGFPKNIDTGAEPFSGDPAQIHPTFDNSATTDELRYLARMYDVTKDSKYSAAVVKGIDYILKAQYPNGGWPQCVPPKPAYASHITFNDGAMARVMFYLKEVATDSQYDFVDADRRKACAVAWDKGVGCILKCQIKVDGKLTAWCQQHDEKTLAPAWARAFEPPSLTACETVGIVHVLMSIKNPSPEVIASVDAAVAWLDAVKIPGIRVEDRPQKDAPHGIERFVIEDASAEPMWSRYYEIGTNKPIFCGRDSVIKYKLSDIEIERRTGYQWLKYWPQDLLAKDYPRWKAKLAGATMQPPN
jgi:PelA/Pel-15E family pectate lyase